MKSILYALMALSLTACAPMVVRPAVPVHTDAVAPAVTMVHVDPPISVYVPTQLAPAALPLSATPVVLNDAEVKCVALAMLYEAGGEGDRGQIAVGYIVTNRMSSSKYPPTACGVVHEGVTYRHGHVAINQCQFHVFCNGHSTNPKNAMAYQHSVDLAKLVLLRMAPNPIGHCNCFHQAWVHTRWDKSYASIRRIGKQVFYVRV
jgi:spore germination cell wall hydrolase CwlJ-like protein